MSQESTVHEAVSEETKAGVKKLGITKIVANASFVVAAVAGAVFYAA